MVLRRFDDFDFVVYDLICILANIATRFAPILLRCRATGSAAVIRGMLVAPSFARDGVTAACEPPRVHPTLKAFATVQWVPALAEGADPAIPVGLRRCQRGGVCPFLSARRRRGRPWGHGQGAAVGQETSPVTVMFSRWGPGEPTMKRAAIFTAAAALGLSITGAALAQTAGTDATTKPGSDAPKSGQASDIKQQEDKRSHRQGRAECRHRHRGNGERRRWRWPGLRHRNESLPHRSDLEGFRLAALRSDVSLCVSSQRSSKLRSCEGRSFDRRGRSRIDPTKPRAVGRGKDDHGGYLRRRRSVPDGSDCSERTSPSRSWPDIYGLWSSASVARTTPCRPGRYRRAASERPSGSRPIPLPPSSTAFCPAGLDRSRISWTKTQSPTLARAH